MRCAQPCRQQRRRPVEGFDRGIQVAAAQLRSTGAVERETKVIRRFQIRRRRLTSQRFGHGEEFQRGIGVARVVFDPPPGKRPRRCLRVGPVEACRPRLSPVGEVSTLLMAPKLVPHNPGQSMQRDRNRSIVAADRAQRQRDPQLLLGGLVTPEIVLDPPDDQPGLGFEPLVLPRHHGRQHVAGLLLGLFERGRLAERLGVGELVSERLDLGVGVVCDLRERLDGTAQLDRGKSIDGLDGVADHRYVSLLQHHQHRVQVSQTAVEAEHSRPQARVVVLLSGACAGVLDQPLLGVAIQARQDRLGHAVAPRSTGRAQSHVHRATPLRCPDLRQLILGAGAALFVGAPGPQDKRREHP